MKQILLYIFFLLTCITGSFGQDFRTGLRLYEESKFNESLKYFEAVKKGTSDYAESRYYIGLVYQQQRDLDKAEASLKQAIDANPNIAVYHMALGAVYAQQVTQVNAIRQALYASRIKSAFETAAQLDPKNLTARWALVNFYARAPKVMGGDMDKAKSTANEMLRINTAEGSRAWGQICQIEDKPDQAETYYRRALTLAPDSLSNYTTLASFYQSVKKFNDAFLVYERAAEKFSANRSLLLQAGRSAALSGQNNDKGEKMLLKHIENTTNKNDRNLAEAYYYLGLIEQNKGNKTAARRQFDTALRLNPDHRLSQEALKSL